MCNVGYLSQTTSELIYSYFVYKGDEYGKLHDLRKKVVERVVSFGDTCQVGEIDTTAWGMSDVRTLVRWGSTALICVWLRNWFCVGLAHLSYV